MFSRQGGPANGPPVVLVHGIGVSGTYMVPAGGGLAAEGMQVYIPDLPGFGRSDKPRKVSTVQDLAEDLAGYMDAHQMRRATLLGNSFGCQIIAEFCVRYPERVTCIVLLGPTMERGARTMWQQFWRLLVDCTREPLSQVAVVAADYLKFGLVRYIRTVRCALRDRIEEKAPRIPVPTLVMRGSRDPIASQEWVEELGRLFPEGRVAVVAGGPHNSHYACTEPFIDKVMPFIREAEQSEAEEQYRV